jgi:hypothetical protein
MSDYILPTLVYSADYQHLGVLTFPPEDEEPPEGALGYVVWWPRTDRETHTWVTEEDISRTGPEDLPPFQWGGITSP